MYAAVEPDSPTMLPWPNEDRLEQAAFLLEYIADDPNQSPDMRSEAVLYKVNLCEEFEYNDKDWNHYRVAGDDRLMDILKAALELMPEPEDLQQKLAYLWVKEDVEIDLNKSLVGGC